MTTFKRFSKLDCPPDVPADPFFDMAVTTVVSDAEPYRIGNDLLDLFGTIPGKVVKVNTTKFTIKAEVEIYPAPCLLKVRIYRLGEKQFAVEFQRRSGDSICFQNLFKCASALLLDFATPPLTSQHHRVCHRQYPHTSLDRSRDFRERPVKVVSSVASECSDASLVKG